MVISMNDMENIKKLLDGYEAPYDHNDWIKLEKDLPKPPGLSGLTKTILVATALIIAVGSVIFLSQVINNDNSKTEKISSTQITESNSAEDNITGNDQVNEIEIDNSIDNSNVQNTIENNDLSNNIENEITNSNTNQQETSNEVNSVNNTTNNAEKSSNSDDNTQTPINNYTPSVDKVVFSVEIVENCVPAKVIFRAINVPENCEVIWNTDENLRVYGNTASHTYIESGIYKPEAILNYNNKSLKTEKLREITINESTNVKINFENSENLYYFTCNNKEELRLLWSIDNQQFSEKEISFEFERGGEYLVKLVAINDFGCKSETSEKVNIVIEHVYFVPNAFIPNSGGVNSNFGPIGENMEFESYKLIIVDGNGNAVFESDSPDFMWNGKINNIGAEAKPGFYLWEIKTLDKFGNLQTKKGRVNLIRN
jgi:hypothetical protein